MNITKEALLERLFIKHPRYEIFTLDKGDIQIVVSTEGRLETTCVVVHRSYTPGIPVRNCHTIEQLDSLISMFLE